MCGRFTLRTPESEIAALFDVEESVDLPLRFNIAPTQAVAVVRCRDDSSARELAMLHWGLIPAWAKDAKIGNRMINARSETAAVKPSFRSAFRRRRCLIPADGFYEWQKTPDGKQPFYIRMQDERPFGFAGLWERWDRGDEPIESCTILTTEASERLRPLHDRMPVIVSPEDYARWLDPRLEQAEDLMPLLRPYTDDSLVALPVSRVVNSPRNDRPECIQPISA